jgi:hypothetical protein
MLSKSLLGYELAFAMMIKVTLVIKFDVENLNGGYKFNLWFIKMRALLFNKVYLR